ncbi:hypothetical protein [Chelativorans intermedius]|uniref:Uncharacterized protein n=1 Tax=Chelativorans intermedius TaxID=515947 RepID=A0ABV6DBE9_9HYPH|nr:hypothetical protein [Chelativorans intermedius]MCT9000274.1 hypothetical protein [Chelativorans intermedius]
MIGNDARESKRIVLTAHPWLLTMRRYFLFVAVANLAWEVLHLPLYTLWAEGTAGDAAFAALHCTGGDLLIALSSLMLALFLAGDSDWPQHRYRTVAGLAIIFGFVYTVFSEWLNTVIRESWAYSELMPVIPGIEIGLSPLAQWIVIPLLGFWWARPMARNLKSELSADARGSERRRRHV